MIEKPKNRIETIEDIVDLNNMTTDELLEYAQMMDALNAKIIKEDYLAYLKNCYDGFKVGKHIQYIVDKLDWFMNPMQTDKRFLVISMPPQHGKSQTITNTFPSWYLMKNPKKRVLLVAYNSDFAEDFGKANLEKIQRYQRDFNITLNPQAKRPASMYISGYNGFIKTFGVMSGITGKSGDLVIIDDPVKNRQEANSPTTRERVWSELKDSIISRLQADSKVILILTRWHEDDVAGRLIAQVPGQCEVVNIPLEAEEDDILGRDVGDPLFPEIGKDINWLREFKKIYLSRDGKRSWEALYQGRPSIAEGDMIPVVNFQYYTKEEMEGMRFPLLIMSVDTALKTGDDNDYSVCSIWGKVGNRYYLIDMDRGRYQYPELKRQIKMMHRQYTPAYTYIEAKASGQPVIDELRRELFGIIPVTPKDGKISRTQAVLGAIESGCVYLPDEHPLLYDFLQECKVFPNGKHDDMVDSMTQALHSMLYQSAPNLHAQRTPDAFGVFNIDREEKNGVNVGNIFGSGEIGEII